MLLSSTFLINLGKVLQSKKAPFLVKETELF